MDLSKLTDIELCVELKKMIGKHISSELSGTNFEKALEIYNTNQELKPFNDEFRKRKLDVRNCLKN